MSCVHSAFLHVYYPILSLISTQHYEVEINSPIDVPQVEKSTSVQRQGLGSFYSCAAASQYKKYI